MKTLVDKFMDKALNAVGTLNKEPLDRMPVKLKDGEKGWGRG